jgi:hypothetical protein
MKKQVNVSLTYLLTYFPEDLGLDDSAPRTALMDYADVAIDEVTRRISEITGLEVNDIEVEVCESN